MGLSIDQLLGKHVFHQKLLELLRDKRLRRFISYFPTYLFMWRTAFGRLIVTTIRYLNIFTWDLFFHCGISACLSDKIFKCVMAWQS